MLTDERLASALGFKVDKVYKETRGSQYVHPAPSAATTTLTTIPTQELVGIEAGEERVPIAPHQWRATRAQPPSATGSMIYIVILILISASIFGLEVYRIREVSDLTERMQMVHNDIDLLRDQLMLKFVPPQHELVDLYGEKRKMDEQTRYQRAKKK